MNHDGCEKPPTKSFIFFVSFCPPYIVQSLFKQPHPNIPPQTFVRWKILPTGRGPQQTTHKIIPLRTLLFIFCRILSPAHSCTEPNIYYIVKSSNHSTDLRTCCVDNVTTFCWQVANGGEGGAGWCYTPPHARTH